MGEHDAHPPLFPSFAHKSGVRASNGEREREREGEWKGERGKVRGVSVRVNTGARTRGQRGRNLCVNENGRTVKAGLTRTEIEFQQTAM